MILRIWRSFFFFVLGFGLMFSGGMAFAETIPASNGTNPVFIKNAEADCKAVYPASTGIDSYWQSGKFFCSGNRMSSQTTPSYSALCPTFTYGVVVPWTINCIYNGYYCPTGQNWTLSGSTCTRPDCVAPEVRGTDGVCRASCPAAGTSVGSSSSWYTGGGSGVSMCISGCSVNAATCASGFSGSGSITGRACQGPFVATGESCSTSTSGTNGIATTNADPATVQNNQNAINCLQSGQGYGTVNGVTVCSGAPNNTTSASKTTTTTTNPTTNTTSTNNKTTTTSCTGDACTSTTTQTDPANPTGPGITTTQQESKSDFCKANPKDAACKSTPSEQEDYCSENPDVVGCKKLGDAPDSPDIEEQNKGVGNITPTTGGNGSCPANVSLPRGAEFSYAPMCDLASGVRPVVLAIAWLIAGGMIFAWFKL